MPKNKTSFKSDKGLLTKKQKKVTFFSAVLLIIGSSIGAGIFLKNGEILSNVQGSIVLAFLSWIIAIVGVVCMGVSLIEVSSVKSEQNGGVVAWNKIFNNAYIFKAAKNFMAYVYLPLNFFLMPYYSVMTIQDAFGWQTQWWVAFLIAFAISMWFIVSSGLYVKAGDIQNKIIMGFKFIPIVFAGLVGIVLAIAGQSRIGQDGYPSWWINDGFKNSRSLISSIFPLTGVIASIPAIIFSFDGFYSACGIETEMEHPEKIGKAMVVGLLIVSGIDVLISISLLIGSQGGKVNTLYWFNEHNAHWVITIVELFIAFGVLGIVNGFSLMTTRYYEYLVQNNEIWCPDKYKSKCNASHPVVGCIYALIICGSVFIVFTFIGSFAFSDTGHYAKTVMVNVNNKKTGYGYDSSGTNLCGLYSMCDILANWTSIMVFLCIVGSIIGALINRKTHTVKGVKPSKGFTPCAIISSVIISIGILFIIASTIGNIPIVCGWKSQIGGKDGYTHQQWVEDLVGVIVTLVLLFVIAGISFIPSIVSVQKQKNIDAHKRNNA